MMPRQGFQPQPTKIPVPAPGEAVLWIGELHNWMDDDYMYTIFGRTGEVSGVKIVDFEPSNYGFIEFISRAAAERVLLTYNNTLMPNSTQSFNLDWATLDVVEIRQDEGQEYTVYVGDLADDVTDNVLQETFKAHYPSVKGAKVVTDKITRRTRGFGFVMFSNEAEQKRAMVEMNGVVCSTRPMRIGPAKTKKHGTSKTKKHGTSKTKKLVVGTETKKFGQVETKKHVGGAETKKLGPVEAKKPVGGAETKKPTGGQQYHRVIQRQYWKKKSGSSCE